MVEIHVEGHSLAVLFEDTACKEHIQRIVHSAAQVLDLLAGELLLEVHRCDLLPV